MSQAPRTNVSLILRVADPGDIESWHEFAAIYQPLVFRIAMAKGLQAADAEDLVQEVMARVAKSVAGWDPDGGKGTFRGWISTIARNLVIDFLRKRNRIPVASGKTDIRRMVEEAAGPCPDSNYFDQEYERQTFIHAANTIRNDFSDSTWQAFWKTAVKNESVKRVAKSLEISTGAVYVARSRVMSRLKAKIHSMQSAEVQDV